MILDARGVHHSTSSRIAAARSQSRRSARARGGRSPRPRRRDTSRGRRRSRARAGGRPLPRTSRRPGPRARGTSLPPCRRRASRCARARGGGRRASAGTPTARARRAPRRPTRRPTRAGRTPAARCRRSGRYLRSASIEPRRAGHEPRSVARHRRALAQRVEDGDAGDRSSTSSADGGRRVEPELAVRLVGADEEVVLVGERGELLVERERRDGRRRVVRVVDPDERRPRRASRRRARRDPGGSRAPRAAARARPALRRTPRRARSTGYAGSGTSDGVLRPLAVDHEHCAKLKIASLLPSVGMISVSGVELRRRTAARSSAAIASRSSGRPSAFG